MEPLAVVLGFGVILAGWTWWSRRRPRKQCPECGAYVAAEAPVCRFCGYAFA